MRLICRKRASPRDRRCTAFMLLRQASYGKKERLVGDMLDKETYYLKKMKLLMLQIFNMVMKTEETALKETASSHNISVSEMPPKYLGRMFFAILCTKSLGRWMPT